MDRALNMPKARKMNRYGPDKLKARKIIGLEKKKSSHPYPYKNCVFEQED